MSPRSGKLLLWRAVVGGSRPPFVLTCRPSSANPRGDGPWRCQDRPTHSPLQHPPASRAPPLLGRARAEGGLSCSLARVWLLGLLVRGVAVPVEFRELLTAAGVLGVVVPVLGLPFVSAVFVSRGRSRAGRARNECAGPAAPKRSAVTSCAWACSAQPWPVARDSSSRLRASCCVSGAAVRLLAQGLVRVLLAGVPGAGRDVDEAKTGGDGSDGDGLHAAKRRALI